MNTAISFFVGCITFVAMMFIKKPIKRVTFGLAEKKGKREEDKRVLYKRLNIMIIFAAMFVAMIFYYLVLIFLGETHFKMCCSLKAGAVSVALYVIFEQWFGDNFQI